MSATAKRSQHEVVREEEYAAFVNMRRQRDDLLAALTECAGHDRDPAKLRDLSRRLCDSAPIQGADKGAAAEIIAEYARFIRVARAALKQAEE